MQLLGSPINLGTTGGTAGLRDYSNVSRGVVDTVMVALVSGTQQRIRDEPGQRPVNMPPVQFVTSMQ